MTSTQQDPTPQRILTGDQILCTGADRTSVTVTGDHIELLCSDTEAKHALCNACLFISSLSSVTSWRQKRNLHDFWLWHARGFITVIISGA